MADPRHEEPSDAHIAMRVILMRAFMHTGPDDLFHGLSEFVDDGTNTMRVNGRMNFNDMTDFVMREYTKWLLERPDDPAPGDLLPPERRSRSHPRHRLGRIP